jgi:hypothetical protein
VPEKKGDDKKKKKTTPPSQKPKKKTPSKTEEAEVSSDDEEVLKALSKGYCHFRRQLSVEDTKLLAAAQQGPQKLAADSTQAAAAPSVSA